MPVRKKKEVINFVSADPDLEDWIRDFAKHLSTNPDKNVVHYPESFATGYAKVLKVQDGLTYRLVDYKLNTDFVFNRKPSREFYLIIYFYRYKNCHQLNLSINGKNIIENVDADYSSLLLTNSFAHQQLKVTKDTFVQGLTIQLSEDWLKTNLTGSKNLNLGLLYDRDIFQTVIKPRSASLLDQIFSRKIQSTLPELYISSRVLQLLDYFLDDISKNGLKASRLPVSSIDVQSILTVENFLLQNYRGQFPSINALAKMAYMSESKLKQVFKKAFGMSLFEYFQKNRMQKAKELLQSNLYNVSEVGEMLGYQNLSNFSVAFKKEFGKLPKDATHLD